MSRAFTKEGDDQWLEDISPTMNALVVFLTRENNGIAVYEVKTHTDANGRKLHEMSNGLTYGHDDKGRWKVM